MSELEDIIDPENWTTIELFNYCQVLNIISIEDRFKDWMYNRSDLLQLVKDDIANNIHSEEL